MKKNVKGYFILVSICSFIMLGGVLNIFDEEHPNDSGDFILMAFLGFWVFFGIYKIMKIKKQNAMSTVVADEDAVRDIENELLNIIRSYNGKVTPIEVAAASRLKIEEVEEFLEKMCQKGFGRIEITDTGSCLYVFEGFLSKEERFSSTSVFDR